MTATAVGCGVRNLDYGPPHLLYPLIVGLLWWVLTGLAGGRR